MVAENVQKVQKIIRVAETNVDGNKSVAVGIRKIKGLSFMFANAISTVSDLGNKKIGELTESELKGLEDIIFHPESHNIPKWLYNRKKDPETGEDIHLSVSQLDLRNKMDVDKMRKIKSYKGIRHSMGLPVRGQRTRSSFRKGRSVGVSKKSKGKKS